MRRKSPHYYTLVASLPWLPRFDRTDRLPITRERLLKRFRMLNPDDAELVERGIEFLAWYRHPVERTDAEMVSAYERLMTVIDDPVVLTVIELAVDQRMIIVALRRRHRGLPAPTPGEPWGVGRWVHHIERNWDDPDFKLKSEYPWISQARAHLEAGETLALDRLLIELLWDCMDRFLEKDMFSFEALLAYLFKWGLINQWLSYNREAAKARFEQLVMEVSGADNNLFD